MPYAQILASLTCRIHRDMTVGHQVKNPKEQVAKFPFMGPPVWALIEPFPWALNEPPFGPPLGPQ